MKLRNINKLGVFLWRIHCIEVFPDGSGLSFIYNKWHPVTYLVLSFGIVIHTFMEGFPDLKDEWKHNKFGLRYTDYWKANQDKIKFLSRYEKNTDT